MNTMDLQVVTVLATLLIIVAGDCDVYGNQQPRIIERCAQIQDCFSKALLNNRNNLYILDQVFRSTQTRPPTSLIVNYNVISITNDCNVTRDYDGASSGSGIDAGVVTDTQQLKSTNDTDDCYGASNNYTEASGIDSIGVTQIKLGWSSTGIHKVIRPDVLVALQPAVYWWLLSIAIDNKGLPRTVHLKLNITNTTECELLEDITGVEMKEALEHLTEKLNYEVLGKVWNVTTDSLSTEELGLLIPMITLGSVTVVLLLYILPFLNNLIPRLPRHISFAVVIPFPIMALEIFANRNINTGHGAVIHDILTVVIMVLSILSCPYGNRMSYISIKKKYWNSLLYPLLFLIAITLTVFSLPVLIEAFIYPIEVIAIIGLFVISLAGSSAIYTTMDWFYRNGTPICTNSSVRKKNRNLRSTHQNYIIKLGFSFCMAVGTVVGSVIIYMTLLRHRLESPTSQQLPTLLVFILPIFAGFGSFLLRKTLAPGTKDKSEATDETESDDNTNTPTKQTTHSHCDSATTDQQSDTNSSNNQTDPPQGDPPTYNPWHWSDTQRWESPQESEEIQVTVEVHPTNNSDVI